jgi:hypothetical protein
MFRRPPPRQNIQISDQPLAFLADIIGVADDAAPVVQGVTVERLHLYEALDQLGGGPQIPVEA